MYVHVDIILPGFRPTGKRHFKGTVGKLIPHAECLMRIFMSLCGIKHYEHRIRMMWTIQGGKSPCQHTKNTVKPSLCIFPLFVWYIANATRWLRPGSKHVTFQHLPTNTCCMGISLYTLPYVYVLSTISCNESAYGGEYTLSSICTFISMSFSSSI